MSGRGSQVSRFFAVLDLLEGAPQGLSVKEIQSRLKERGHDADIRTVYRDIEAIGQFGWPITEEKCVDRAANCWKIEKSVKVNQYLTLTARSLFALFLARGLLAPLRESIIHQDLDAAFRRIEEKLGKKSVEYLDGLSTEVCFQPSVEWGIGLNADVLETIRAACAEGHVLEMTYTSAHSGVERKRKVGPHFLYFAKGGIYLVAEDLEASAVKVFSIPRISKAEMLDSAYQGVVTNAEDLFKDTIGIFRGSDPVEVTLEFEAQAAPYVRERKLHSSQRIIAKQDGKIRVLLEVAVTPELVQWILGFGAAVYVSGPAELQERVGDAAQKAADLYSGRKKSA